jgi:hypothetical protein
VTNGKLFGRLLDEAPAERLSPRLNEYAKWLLADLRDLEQ